MATGGHLQGKNRVYVLEVTMYYKSSTNSAMYSLTHTRNVTGILYVHTLLTYVHSRQAEDDLTAVSTTGSPLLLHSIYATTPITITQSLLLPQTPFSRPINLSLTPPPPHIHHPTPSTPPSLSRSQSHYSQSWCQS